MVSLLSHFARFQQLSAYAENKRMQVVNWEYGVNVIDEREEPVCSSYLT